MPRWSPDAALVLEEAAMALFAERGYAETTVPQIAERAGLTTRTFFRHFAEKREVLFLRDRELPTAVGSILAGLPRDLSTSQVVERGLSLAAVELEQWREPIVRRNAIIRGDEHLRERELLKLEHLAQAISQALVTRDVPPAAAHVTARVATLVFDLAMRRWLDAETASLQDELTRAWDDVRATTLP